MSKKTYGKMITELGPHQVFVFGSNYQGFHGGGAAGFASFGKTGNVWREEGYGERHNGWRGLWNIKGIFEGLQEGSEGRSYAIPTIVRPGLKRSLNKDQIIDGIKKMYNTAIQHPEWEFLVAGSDTGGDPLNGYTHIEMIAMYVDAGPIPDNVIFSDSYQRLIINFIML
jgi:hypothetical protein